MSITLWEDMTELEQLQVEFSDYFKETHGVRPRNFADKTVEELKEQIALMDRINGMDKQWEQEYQAKVKAERAQARKEWNDGDTRFALLKTLKG